jgi:hypothetical protein
VLSEVREIVGCGMLPRMTCGLHVACTTKVLHCICFFGRVD